MSPSHLHCCVSYSIANCVFHLCHTQLFGDVCYHCNRVIEGDGEHHSFDLKNMMNQSVFQDTAWFQPFSKPYFAVFISGFCPQQGLVCQLFRLLYLQQQAYSKVSNDQWGVTHTHFHRSHSRFTHKSANSSCCFMFFFSRLNLWCYFHAPHSSFAPFLIPLICSLSHPFFPPSSPSILFLLHLSSSPQPTI